MNLYRRLVEYIMYDRVYLSNIEGFQLNVCILMRQLQGLLPAIEELLGNVD